MYDTKVHPLCVCFFLWTLKHNFQLKCTINPVPFMDSLVVSAQKKKYLEHIFTAWLYMQDSTMSRVLSLKFARAQSAPVGGQPSLFTRS